MKGHARHEHGGFSSAGEIDVEAVIAASGIKRGQIVLDLGCGPGDYSVAASKIVSSEGKVYALDKHGPAISGLMERIGSSGIQNMIGIEGDMTLGIPMDDAEIDVILLFNVLHGLVHNGEEGEVLDEVSRILKPGGTLAVMEPLPGKGGKGPPDDIRLSFEEIAAFLSKYGLSVMRSIEITKERGLLILEKENAIGHHKGKTIN